MPRCRRSVATVEAEVVAELAKDINASLDLDTVIRRVVEGAKDHLASDQARITLRDPQSGVMRFRYSIGVKYEGYGEATIEPGRELGIPIYLTKPIIQSDLWDAIVTALRGTARESCIVPRRPQPLACSGQRRSRILVAEDNTINQKLLVHMLCKRGYQAAMVNNGTEVLATLAHDCFDLVLMDVQMPELDGIEATMAIRARERETGGYIPIIALTAHAMKDDQARCLAAGMDAYVSKPVKADELFATIDRFCMAASAPNFLPDDPPVDLAAALRAMDGDATLLTEMVALFQQVYPKYLAELRGAVAHGDAAQLAHSAHSLTGAVAVFHATTAYSLAAELETMGQAARLENVSTVLEKLDDELTRIIAFFAEYESRREQRP